MSGDQRALSYTAPAGKTQAATVGTTYTQGRALLISCTVSGNVVVAFADGSSVTIALPAAGVYEFNWSVTGITTSGTTATATYYILY